MALNYGVVIAPNAGNRFVTYKNGATSNSGATSETSWTVTYSPTAGNLIVAGLKATSISGTVTCKDQNGNALSQVAVEVTTFLFQGIAVSGATSYIFTWSTGSGRVAAFVGEYTKDEGIGTNNKATGTGIAPSVSLTTTKNKSLVAGVVGIGINTTFTSSQNVRLQTTNGAGNSNAIALLDTAAGASGSSATLAATTTSGTWSVIAVELYPRQ
jgi:hypothetical protein